MYDTAPASAAARSSPRPVPPPSLPTQADSTAGERPTSWHSSPRLIAVLLGLGIALRLLQYAGNRSLWLDEVLMVPGIVQRSFAELLHPGSWGAIPPGFLLLSRLSVAAFGNNELALRLVPVLAGLASLFAFLLLARKVLTPRAVPIALALFAISPFLVYYASEVKPYSSDVLVALLLFLLAVRLHERELRLRDAAIWGFAGIAAVALSFTAAFVVAGVTLALLLSFWRRRERRSVAYLLLPCAGWVLLFAAPYLLFLRGTGQSEYLRAFWASGYMPFPPRSIADLAWYSGTFVRVFRDPLGVISDRQTEAGFYQAAAGMIAFTAGFLWMWTRRRTELLILTLPIAAALVASALQVYPFGGRWTTGGRVILFLVPGFLLVMGEGIEQLREKLGPSMRGLAYALLALLLVPSLVWAAFMVPSGRDEIKPVLSYVQEQWRPGDLLYVHYDIKYPFAYYASRFGFGSDAYVFGVCARAEPQQYLAALDQLRGRSRVWVLFGHGRGASQLDEKGLMLSYLEHTGRRLDDRIAIGSSVYLFDMREGVGSGEPFSVRMPNVPPGVDTSCVLWN